MKLDPASAALYAIIAICLVLVGGLLTAGSLTAEQRATLLAGIVGVLIGIGWLRRRGGDDEAAD